MVGHNGQWSQQSTPSQSLSVQRHSNKRKGIAKPSWERTLRELMQQQQRTLREFMQQQQNINKQISDALGIGCSGTTCGGQGTDRLNSVLDYFLKRFKELEERIDQIPGAPMMVNGIDMKRLSQTPWKPSAAPMPTPENFRMPNLTIYDGTTDPLDHLLAYIVGIRGNEDLTDAELESMLVKKFVLTLTKGALTWYTHLPEHSIGSFRELAEAFMKAYAWLRT